MCRGVCRSVGLKEKYLAIPSLNVLNLQKFSLEIYCLCLVCMYCTPETKRCLKEDTRHKSQYCCKERKKERKIERKKERKKERN